MRVYRWDLDKTYLHTEFESWRGIVRTALERAHHKRTVPGAAPLLQALGRTRDGRSSTIVIVSGSPEQMRAVLEEKLRLDGVRFDALMLKDNLGNLRRGRLRAMRHQLGYKVPLLLRGRVGLHPSVTESLFGDDVEIDALAYTLFADAVAGRVSPAELARVLERGGAYPDHIVDALAALHQVERSDAVQRIFIRRAKGRAPAEFLALGARVVPVSSWLQAGLVLFGSREIEADDVERVLEASTLPDRAAIAEIHDVLDRGLLPPEALDRLLREVRPGPVFDALERRLVARDFEAAPLVPAEPIDYLDVLARFGGG